MRTVEQQAQKPPVLQAETFVSSLQFISIAGGAGWTKFASIFFLENGVTASQLAIVTSVQSITKFLGYPTYDIYPFYTSIFPLFY